MKNKFINFLIFLILFGYGVIGYWMFYPYTPLIVKSPIKICNEGKMVCPGGNLIYELDYDKKMPVSATISKQIVDGFVITYAPIIGNVETGKAIKKFKLPISVSADPGDYKLKWEAQYRVNPIRTINIIVWSEPFKICE